ncbi:hypothetical protein QFC20_003804 [Naganishia adeliensis]|uniref:Uncharacterized protein n=1 Tax=Naganishia adeliensis TaxID=92952 RepID=A0ACC2W5T0_9TREE|nr:hypothetical protein QFC20_003804 [Naganishia adeliensis]
MVASTDSTAPLITVFGATGTQGGSVIDHLLSSSKPYRIRAVTRDPSKPSGKKLEEKGCDVVKAEMGNENEVKKVLEGSEIVFGVTNFWEHGAEKEISDGKILINAIKSTPSIKTFLWSGIESVSKISQGKYTHVQHFDTKAELTEIAKREGLPLINVQPAMYMENFLGQMGQEDGTYLLALPVRPESKFHLINCRRDYGAYVVGALESEDVKPGDGEVLACAQEITAKDVVAQWERINNVKCTYVQAPADQFQSMVGAELTQMLQFFDEFGYYGGKDIEPSQKVLPETAKVQTWEGFVKASDWSKVLSG